MIREEIFFLEFAVLMERFGRSLNGEIQVRYLEFFTEHQLSESEFLAASKLVFNGKSFGFPAPQDFVDAVRGAEQQQALEAWADIMARMANGIEPMTDPRSVTRTALNAAAMGNGSSIKAMDFKQLDTVQRHFMSHYAAELQKRSRQALSSGNTPTLEVTT